MNVRSAFDAWLTRARSLYEPREAERIADWVFERKTGMRRLDRITWPTRELPEEMLHSLQQALSQLEEGMPVQYILEEAWFMGESYIVRPGVLIPRPETEELLEWMLADLSSGPLPQPLRLLDLGTGSGCIPIAFQKQVPAAECYGLDISRQALAIAAENSQRLKVQVRWLEADMRRPETLPELPEMTLVISNPPYIPQHEAAGMQAQVRDFEPHMALFVPDEDPLLFYKILLGLAPRLGCRRHRLYLELHEDYAEDALRLCQNSGYGEATLKKDISGKTRMLRLSDWNPD